MDPRSALRTLKLALLYFALVFGAGFLLGPLRVLFVVPRVGERAAELLEMPLMIAVIWFAARLVARRADDLPAAGRLRVGVAAVMLVLLADTMVGVYLRGLSVVQVLVERDPVSGTAFYASLAFCALAPWLAGRRLAGRVARGTR